MSSGYETEVFDRGFRARIDFEWNATLNFAEKIIGAVMLGLWLSVTFLGSHIKADSTGDGGALAVLRAGGGIGMVLGKGGIARKQCVLLFPSFCCR